jgi:TolA-binding protein
MLTRQEVLEALRTLSEEVLSSLRLLFSMTRAVMPEESVLESDMNPINQLIQEVKNQRGKIRELTQIIESQFTRSMGHTQMSPTATETTSGDMWEFAEMEDRQAATKPAARPTCSGPKFFSADILCTDEPASSSSNEREDGQDCRNPSAWSPISGDALQSCSQPSGDRGKSTRTDPNCI